LPYISVHCLYCGKELGPLQLLRSEEYCTPAHRKKYQERLGRVLNRIADNEPRANRTADFVENWPTHSGNSKQIELLEFRHGSQHIFGGGPFLLTIAPVSCDRPAAMQAPAARQTESPLASADVEPLLGSAAALPEFAIPVAEPPRAERSVTAGPRDLQPPRPAPLPVGQTFWPAATAPNGKPHGAVLPAFAMDTVKVAFDRPALCESPGELSSAVEVEVRVSSTACDLQPRLAAAHAGALPSFALGPVRASLAPPSLCELPAELAAGASAGYAPVPAGCDWAPKLPAARAASMPEFTLATAEAPQAETRTAVANLEPAALCGICVPVPSAQPAVCSVDRRAEPQWRWPSAGVAYPSVSAATASHRPPALPCELAFAPSPAADPVEAFLNSAMCAVPFESYAGVRLPANLPRAMQTTMVPLAAAAAMASVEPEPIALAPVAALDRAVSPAAMMLPPAAVAIGAPALFSAAPCEFLAAPAESLPRVEFSAAPSIAPFALHYPQFAFAGRHAAAAAVAGADPWQPVAARPAAASVVPAPLDPLSSVRMTTPHPDLCASTATAVPRAAFVPLEFFCRRVNSVPVLTLGCIMPRQALRQPKFLIGAAMEVVEERAPAAPPRKNAAAEVFQLPGARKPYAWVREIARPLAACFLVGAFLWAVATTMRVATHTAAVNRDVATIIQDAKDAPSAAVAAAPAAAPAAETGFMARVRSAIESRAASQLTETFHEGMGAWAESKKNAPAGWARSPEGYVRPAAFALFRPSESYRDYRMEFFGQIEQKGLSWAVRAADPKNYYAMKFRVVEPGLRPVVAIEHYPVVNGHKGHRTQVPLPELMFHNNTPYRVEVAVRGDRIVTSVEGQEVDTWTDDTLSKGGVGFYADAGEKSRLYWVKVAKNEDFLGRICAYITGGGDHPASADLWPAGSAPQGPFGPAPAGSPEPSHVALATLFAFRRSQHQRRSAWSL
jgi:hypothetical protein